MIHPANTNYCMSARVSSVVFSLIILVACLAGAPSPLQAQEVGRIGNIQANGVPYRTFAETGEATIRVYVISPGGSGIYEIGADTRFDELLALASIAPPPRQPQTRQSTMVRLYHQERGRRALVLEERVEDLLQRDPNNYPQLSDGDFLQVETRTSNRFGWQDGLRILTSLTSLVTLARVFGWV